MTQKCRFSHPLYDTYFEMDIPVEMTFKEITALLIREGFLEEKKGGYHYIYEDRLMTVSAPLKSYVPEGVECMDILIHGLLIILT